MEMSKVVFDVYERYKDDPLKVHKRDDETEATWQQRICDDGAGATGTVTLPQETRDFLRGLKPGQTKEEWEATFQVNLQVNRRNSGMLSITAPGATNSSITLGEHNQVEKGSEQPRNARAGTMVIKLTDKQFDDLLNVVKEACESQKQNLYVPMRQMQSDISATRGDMARVSTKVKNMAEEVNKMTGEVRNLATNIKELCDNLKPAIGMLTASVEMQKATASASQQDQHLKPTIERYIADNTGR
ncbi:hypothetical protein Moror_4176 [Moniliophthora roreri MCA 2997]|uniref:Uncharacterized protein n=2 Tax=Moniliophthora roreri TaxID=221103 RepID=V2XDV3_MONRO|nr:hypothetical protein Moror_4176 [Moniliophthora roreri MCA 2997]KAI3597490.1 hypothetical protein WG66_013196 [Moniliophthora roreri]